MNKNISLVIQREFLERVSKKSFIITTILMPVLMLALMATPALIMAFAGNEAKTVDIVDESLVIAPALKSDDGIKYITCTQPLDSVRANSTADAVLFIPKDVMDGKKAIQLYNNEASSMTLESNIRDQVNGIIENIRLESYDIANLDQILKEVESDVSIQSYDNTSKDEEKESSTILSYILGTVLTFFLYMCLLLYGQMVMTSIIEEKNNRVLEIVVSSVKPTQLMLGKICGIGLVAVTQIVIWGVLLAALSAFVLPALTPDSVAADLSAMNAAGAAGTESLGTPVELLQALSILGNVGYIIQIFGLLLLFLVGGFMLYAAVYAAIGSAVDNIQDAGQLQSVVVMPIILGIVFGMMAASDPGSQLSLWTSMIPFTSPMVMMARIPFGVPGWQITVSLIILYASFFALVWVAAKIYRVGIFMYGKKPSVKELIRWMRYK
jgi:ABC-2 type transport system permease protein